MNNLLAKATYLSNLLAEEDLATDILAKADSTTNLLAEVSRATNLLAVADSATYPACGGVSPTQSQTITFGVDASGSNHAIARHTKKGELTLTFFLS